MYRKVIVTNILIEYLIDILHIHENIELLYVEPTFVLSDWFNVEGFMDHYCKSILLIGHITNYSIYILFVKFVSQYSCNNCSSMF